MRLDEGCALWGDPRDCSASCNSWRAATGGSCLHLQQVGGKVVMARRLDYMISEVFSNASDIVILQFLPLMYVLSCRKSTYFCIGQ